VQTALVAKHEMEYIHSEIVIEYQRKKSVKKCFHSAKLQYISYLNVTKCELILNKNRTCNQGTGTLVAEILALLDVLILFQSSGVNESIKNDCW
jgi:hypothetical protein